ncbi:DUF3891 family protein [Thermoflavimicrobium dichotomicum]|uniref:DUF3891 domain-containing protein n=1 Tax=Thermoflavimicrobium dichotomicum TaxID=46223 RepID=A0A1I3LX25_9BACL|nr:DUF3891 family protein [Thermoflavimicrobium dichotomicum]SFI89100.1 Protein of unknown function [Thermoflavimicrobium dichotomicum]
MIVRPKDDHFVLIKQHDHALVSGKFAVYWREAITPLAATVFAISYHDVGWMKLDETFLWDEKTDQPTDFLHYPLKEKIEAYKEGISKVGAKEPYAGYLCSKHYASFFQRDLTDLGKKFYEEEQERQCLFKQRLTRAEMQHVEQNFALLQFCDDLSLALCLNEPQANTHPWYRDGIWYQGEKYQWIWESDTHLRLEPNCFSRSFTIRIPYQVVSKNREVIDEQVYVYQILV